MTATVGLFTYAGLEVMTTVAGVTENRAAVQAVKQPILGRDALSCDSTTTDTSETSAAPAATKVALIQVERGKRVYMEICPGDVTAASSASPIFEGDHVIPFGPSWRISCKEVA